LRTLWDGLLEPIPQAATRSAWRRTGRARGSSAASSPTG
jgi:hypothetical protein